MQTSQNLIDMISRHTHIVTDAIRQKKSALPDHELVTYHAIDTYLRAILETCKQMCQTEPHKCHAHVQTAFAQIHPYAVQFFPFSQMAYRADSPIAAVTDVLHGEKNRPTIYRDKAVETNTTPALDAASAKIDRIFTANFHRALTWQDAIELILDIQACMRDYELYVP